MKTEARMNEIYENGVKMLLTYQPVPKTLFWNRITRYNFSCIVFTAIEYFVCINYLHRIIIVLPFCLITIFRLFDLSLRLGFVVRAV